ncbi:MAG: 50S ribosomal protein L17 [Deltaproteobacteria bacterium ADurb.Bin207]|mgnify:CR=1 FL=1|nr:MAG: 50S ribosomal protein L17 [Deltaproteobacteria bacterium ADurb.Bin207]
MRHLKAGRKFGRNPSSRRAMLRNLTANLITHERIETTDAKAKELRRVAERLITKAIRLGDVAYNKPGETPDRRQIARRLHVARQIRAFIPRYGMVANEEGAMQRIDLVEKVLIDLAKRFQGRPGGYTRIIKLGPRRGDNAPMSLIEFVTEGETTATSEPAAEPAVAETGPNSTPEATT